MSSLSAAGGSYAPVFSSDQRHVAFLSSAHNLVLADAPSPFLDVFVRDLQGGRCRIASVNQWGARGGNGHSHSLSISSNAQWVAFASAASDLVDGDVNGEEDIFLRDMTAETTVLVTVPGEGQSSARGEKPAPNVGLSRRPLISADGRRVFFESCATNLVNAPDTNRHWDVFLRDRSAGLTVLLSRSEEGSQAANHGTELGGITPDGHRVVLITSATDLMSGATSVVQRIYVRDVENPTTWWVTEGRETGLLPGDGFMQPALSAEGGHVVFMERRASSGAINLVHHELATRQNLVIDTHVTDAGPAAISADGRHVAFTRAGQVWLWDRVTRSNMLVSAGINGVPATRPAGFPAITSDGSLVLFLSDAPNLVTDALRGVPQVFVRDWVQERTELVSLGQTGAPSRESAVSSAAALSKDGVRVAFESHDPLLVAGDQNQESDIFLRDRASERTTLVSQRDANRHAHTGNGLPFTESRAALSADGGRVAFVSLDSTLSASDTNQTQDVFVADLRNGEIQQISGWFFWNGLSAASRHPILSADGRFLAYAEAYYDAGFFLPGYYDTTMYWRDLLTGEERAVQLPENSRPWEFPLSLALSPDGRSVAYGIQRPGDSFGYDELWVRSMASPGEPAQLVSADVNGLSANNFSMHCSFTPDAQWIVFQSLASNLTTNFVTTSSTQLFARHLPSRTTRLASYEPDGRGLLASTDGVVCSGDSRYVAFHTAGLIYRHDLAQAGPVPIPNLLVCSNCSNPSLDFSGDRVAYVSQPSTGEPRQIMVQDIPSGLTRLASLSRTGPSGGDGHSETPCLSHDGRFVVFRSRASDLIENDQNGTDDVFARDLMSNQTILLSRSLTGTGSANGRSLDPILSADGRTVVFRSFASDLVPGDYNLTADIFVVRLSRGDSDQDGLEDDWEVAYFNSLDRDGEGDYDEDGQTDAAEQTAGTDPTDEGSIFRVLTLGNPGGSGVTLVWAAVPGKSYRVEYRVELVDGNWVALPADIYALHTTASTVDVSAASAWTRFYRVRLLK